MKIEFEWDWRIWILAIGVDFRGPWMAGAQIGPLTMTIERKP